MVSAASEIPLPPVEDVYDVCREAVSLIEQDSKAMRAIFDQTRNIVRDAATDLSTSLRSLEQIAGEQHTILREIGSFEGASEETTLASFVRDISGTVEGLDGALTRMADTTRSVSESTTRLANDLEGVFSVLARVKSLAHHSHILAINASLEAARADDAGEAFGVVASEMRELASKSSRFNAAATDSVDHVRKSMNQVTAELQTAANDGVATAEISRGRTVELVQDLERLERRLAVALDRVDGLSTDAKARAGDAVRALQFEDMVTQLFGVLSERLRRIEYAAYAVQTFARTAEAGRATPIAAARIVGALARARDKVIDSPVQSVSLAEGTVELF
jgi:methyl-accepting chemotaxis protein